MDHPGALMKALVEQNRHTCFFSFDAVTAENQHRRLNESAASIGFIYRHTGEIMHLLATFLGAETEVQNTTMGMEDTGQGADPVTSRELVTSGYDKLMQIAVSHDGHWWEETLDTPFFGKITRLKLFAHILNHNAYHSGQIGLSLKRAPG